MTRYLAAAVLFAVGCGPADPGFVPVRGRVLLGDKPLTTGTVSFRPDPARGNTTLHHPTGPVAADGTYELFTAGRPGAPPGWYKVLVFADANATPAGAAHPAPPKWLTAEKYTREAATDLAVEVVAGAAPGRYDLRLSK